MQIPCRKNIHFIHVYISRAQNSVYMLKIREKMDDGWVKATDALPLLLTVFAKNVGCNLKNSVSIVS